MFTLLLTITACVNNLNGLEEPDSEENSSTVIPNAGKIAIKVSAPTLQERILSSCSTDSLGLFVFTGKSSVKTDIYLGNIPFYLNKEGKFTPIDSIFYPAQLGKSRFWAYYPYTIEGVDLKQGQSVVSIKTDQKQDSQYYHSDFMIAEVANVTNGRSTAVHLPFQHKLTQLNIAIKPESKEDLDIFMRDKPQIIIHQSYTRAIFSFKENEIIEATDPEDIVCNGEWKEENGKITGKRVILIPQILSSGQHIFDIIYRDSTIACTLNESIELESGKESNIQLSYSKKNGISGILPNINEWGEGDNGTASPEDNYKGDSINIKDIDFSRSYIYQVQANKKTIAEIYLEYLFNDQIKSQAITIYPIEHGERIWENGKVLYLAEEKAEYHGGDITWNNSTNSFSYNRGNDKPWFTIFIDESGKISNKRSINNKQIDLRPLTYIDKRKNETKIYPLVKIGLQIWMRKNLNTEFYTNEQRINYKMPDNYQDVSAGFFKSNGEYFYNTRAIQNGEIAPKNWIIADNDSWEKLKDYLKNDAATLKSKTKWLPHKDITSNDKTGFEANPIGIFTQNSQNTKSFYDFEKKFTVFWNMGTLQNKRNSAIMLRYDSNDIKEATYNQFSGYSIRCVKKNAQYVNNQ